MTVKMVLKTVTIISSNATGIQIYKRISHFQATREFRSKVHVLIKYWGSLLLSFNEVDGPKVSLLHEFQLFAFYFKCK